MSARYTPVSPPKKRMKKRKGKRWAKLGLQVPGRYRHRVIFSDRVCAAQSKPPGRTEPTEVQAEGGMGAHGTAESPHLVVVVADVVVASACQDGGAARQGEIGRGGQQKRVHGGRGGVGRVPGLGVPVKRVADLGAIVVDVVERKERDGPGRASALARDIGLHIEQGNPPPRNDKQPKVGTLAAYSKVDS